MKKNLIKINEEHYIVVDDSEIKEGDCIYENDQNNINVAGKDYTKNSNDFKITHSFGSYLDGVENRPLSEIEELLFGYNVEKMAEPYCAGMDSFKEIFKEGFNTHKEIMKDKLFTVDDMKVALKELSRKLMLKQDFTLMDSIYYSIKIIDGLQPTEWEVKLINGKLTLKQ